MPSRRLAGAGRHDVAHDALVNGCGVDPRAADRLAHHERAQLRRLEILEGAEELAGGQSDGADDDGFAHERFELPFKW